MQMAHTSYGHMFKENIGTSPFRSSDANIVNQRIRSPVTEHQYLKVDSMLSHGDDHGNTYGMISGHIPGGTTFSSPKGIDSHPNAPF